MNQPMDTDAFSLRGRRALVVGGTRGIGRAIVCRFAAAGAAVLANYVRNDAAAREVADLAASAGWSLQVVRADAASDKGRDALLAAVAEQFADVSVFVFAAASGVHRPCTEASGRHFDFTYGLNVRAFLLLAAALAPRLADDASIIALSSEGAMHAMSNYGLVGSSKAALEALCRQLAVELAPRGIRVNVLSPGSVRTDAWQALPDAERRLAEAERQTPCGRLTTLDEVAHVAQFLASYASSGVSGHTLVVDGGARVRGAG